MTTEPLEGEPAENLVLRGRSFLVVGVIVLGIAWLARPILGPFIVAAAAAVNVIFRELAEPEVGSA
jgi:hypothetical protein